MGLTLILSGTYGISDLPRICYDNLLSSSEATITVSSEQTGYEKEYAFNWQRYNWWQANAGASEWLKASLPSTRPVNYFAVYSHDLSDNLASITLQYSNNNIDWTNAFDPIFPVNNSPIMVFFDSISYRYWRVLVNSPSVGSKIGIVCFGEYMELERRFKPGFEQPKLARKPKFVTKSSEAGIILARRYQYVRSHFSMDLGFLTPHFVENEWLPFMKHLEINGGYFILWDPIEHPNDTAYCEVTNPSWIGIPRYQDSFYMSLGLQSDAYVE